MKGRSRRHLFALWRKPGSFSGLYKPLLLFTKQDTVMWFMCLDSVARRKRSAEAKAKGNESEREGRRTRRWRRKWENGCWHVHVPITEKERRAQRERERDGMVIISGHFPSNFTRAGWRSILAIVVYTTGTSFSGAIIRHSFYGAFPVSFRKKNWRAGIA